MKRDIHLVVLLLFLIACSLASLTLWKVLASRERALAEVDVHGLNLTQALVTYSEGIVRQSSLLLLGLVERLETEGTGPEQIMRLNQLVTVQQPLMPQLSGITVYDRDGRWLMSSNRPIPVGISSSDRAFFVHHRNDPSAESFIGPPIRSRATQQWVITISRRYNEPNGSFAGVVALTLDVENFLKLFGTLHIGRDGAISLTYADGRLLVRYPFREQDMGRNFSQSLIFTRYLVGNSVGTASLTSSLDGVERLYVFRKSERLPLVTTVAQGKHEALEAWREEAILCLLVVTTLLVIIGIIGWLLIRAINRRIVVEGDLRVAQRQLLDSNRQLECQALRDALTGLANRRSFDQTLAIEFRRAQRDALPLALLLVDVDYFKHYNDHYGHLAGDACLRDVAEALVACTRRPPDLVARYGGEEIAVILPDTDAEGARVVAQAMLEALARLDLPHAGSPFGRVSVSIGLACAPAPELESPRSLIDSADQALYAAKEGGRNRLAMAAQDAVAAQH